MNVERFLLGASACPIQIGVHSFTTMTREICFVASIYQERSPRSMQCEDDAFAIPICSVGIVLQHVVISRA